MKRAPVAFPATSSSTRVKDAVAAFPSRGKAESVAAQPRGSPGAARSDMQRCRCVYGRKAPARIPASWKRSASPRPGGASRLVRRVECPRRRGAGAVEGLATPREDDGYEDVASAEAGARAEESASFSTTRRARCRRRRRLPSVAPPPAGVGTSARAHARLRV